MCIIYMHVYNTYIYIHAFNYYIYMHVYKTEKYFVNIFTPIKMRARACIWKLHISNIVLVSL